MGDEDKLRNKAEDLGGKAKEGLGKVTGDEDVEARGQTEQSKSKLKQAGEKVKDAAGKAKDSLKD
ncbi:CsbD family protein [Sphaerimonospora sp. CA-214678]|uniref:CsbD family protein n=1 Tax=Sphaerimonospora sp. CA-214678 TaxID=3240029 RepID=UPI003D92C386